MHPIVQICCLVLLSAATRADRLLHRQVPRKIADISPFKWAVHDWVPEKNRRTDDRSMPIGAGELEPVPQQNQRRMHKQRPKKAFRKSQKGNPQKVKDVLKRHILKSYQNVRSKVNYDLQQAEIRRRGRHNLHKENVPLFPKDFDKAEERKFQLQNEDVKERLQYQGDVYLPVYRQVLDNLKTYKKQKKEASRRILESQLKKQQDNVAKKLGR